MERKLRAAAILWLAATLATLGTVRTSADNARWGAGYFPNVTLTTHEGATVHFYDDLIKGKIVAINLIYTSCKYSCPLETARMAQVQNLLGERMGRDVFFYSITIDPEHDTPAVLKEYGQKYHAGPGWTFLTGTQADIELISKKLGLYSAPNPANPDGHTPYLLVGNEATGQWMRNSAVDNPRFIARTIGDWLNSWQNRPKEPLKSYAEVPRPAFNRGQYMFSSHCAACHTIGRGDYLGPDLLGVTNTRERSWLTQFILAPEKMNATGDPIAVALRAKYNQVRMPNLDLNEGDAAALIEYIAEQSRVAPQATHVAPAGSSVSATSLKSIMEPYLRIQQALHADSVEGIKPDAAAIAAEAAQLGPAAKVIQASAGTFKTTTDLASARAAMGALSEAMLNYAKETNASLGENVKVAYCPMVRKHWLQKGDTVQNPFYGAAMSDCGRIITAIQSAAK